MTADEVKLLTTVMPSEFYNPKTFKILTDIQIKLNEVVMTSEAEMRKYRHAPISEPYQKANNRKQLAEDIMQVINQTHKDL